MPRGQLVKNSQNFTMCEALVLVVQSVRRWVGTQPLINSAGFMPFEAFFPHLTTHLGRLFSFAPFIC